MKLTLGISPCPNDTFIFDAMLNGLVDNEGLTFDFILEDVETLNKMAINGALDVSKISYGTVPKLLPHYKVLDAGGALGKGVGPLFISKNIIDISTEDLENLTVVLPGMNTTAHLLFSLVFPSINKKVFLPFHEIEDAVINGVADTGVIIHENRFTYEQKNLIKLADLGDEWESLTGLPIPLGGIVARRTFNNLLLKKINRVIRRSLEYAFANQDKLSDFIKNNAQEMDEEVMRKHINLYVNEFSLDLGKAGREAVWNLIEASLNLMPEPAGGNMEVFID
jgi:1,4-dihydroxy-6-naphthoate synthase